jgi:N-acetylneuraminic acid mutarotase
VRAFAFLAFVVLVTAGCTMPVDDILPTEPIEASVVEWRQVANATFPRSEHAVGQIGPDIYIIGGYTDTDDGVPLSERYNVANDTWTTLPDLPAGTHHTSATGVAGRLIVAGGFDMTGPGGLSMTDRAFQYDPETNAWTALPRMPIPRAAHTAVEVAGKLYVIGGYTVALLGHTPQVDIYDPKANAWTVGTPMPTPRDHLAAAAVGGTIYVFGGDIATHSTSSDDVEAYDTATGLWSVKAPMPTVRGSLAAVTVGDKIWVMGGQDGSRTYDDVEEYDPKTDTWKRLPSMLTTRHGFGAAAWGDYVYVV